MGEALEIAKVLVSPIEKLMDIISNGIGVLYEPRHKRKMVDAAVYEINKIGEAMRNAADMPVVYNQDGVAINSEDFNRLIQRAGTRLVLQETIKQHNIENVVDNAYEILEREENCSGEPVEQGWINNFFDSVANVSDEELQNLWGKILAGEIKTPGRFSIRTLDVLRKLSKKEAEIFEKIVPFILKCYGDETKSFYDYFLLSDSLSSENMEEKFGYNFPDMVTLNEAGLISYNALIFAGVNVDIDETEYIETRINKIKFHNISEENLKICHSAYILTATGKELFSVVSENCNIEITENYAEECLKLIISSSFPYNENIDDLLEFEVVPL